MGGRSGWSAQQARRRSRDQSAAPSTAIRESPRPARSRTRGPTPRPASLADSPLALPGRDYLEAGPGAATADGGDYAISGLTNRIRTRERGGLTADARLDPANLSRTPAGQHASGR